MSGLEGALIAFLSDPTYGIPLLIAAVLTLAVSWWSLSRTATPPPLLPGVAPEFWRIQMDSRAYYTLERGEYLVAVDALGRRLGGVVDQKFHIKIGHRADLDAPSVDRVLPSPLTLRSLVSDLSRAYYSAYWAEEPGWLSGRWPWLHRRVQRRAARDFRRVTDEIARALPALEAA
jgi:hypothetical protein